MHCKEMALHMCILGNAQNQIQEGIQDPPESFILIAELSQLPESREVGLDSEANKPWRQAGDRWSRRTRTGSPKSDEQHGVRSGADDHSQCDRWRRDKRLDKAHELRLEQRRAEMLPSIMEHQPTPSRTDNSEGSLELRRFFTKVLMCVC